MGILPIKDFDYKTYDKVTIFLFRIGVVIVAVAIPATSPKGHGDRKLYAQCTTSAGNKPELWIFLPMLKNLKLQSTQRMIKSSSTSPLSAKNIQI